jgi:hypothetical protein
MRPEKTGLKSTVREVYGREGENNDAKHLYLSDLPGLANAIYNEASQVDHTVGGLDKYVHARHEERQLRRTLGLTGRF